MYGGILFLFSIWYIQLHFENMFEIIHSSYKHCYRQFFLKNVSKLIDVFKLIEDFTCIQWQN